MTKVAKFFITETTEGPGGLSGTLHYADNLVEALRDVLGSFPLREGESITLKGISEQDFNQALDFISKGPKA